jgi:regulator of sigma E protease
LLTLLLTVVLLPLVGVLRAAFQVLMAWILGAQPIVVILGIGPSVARRSLAGVPVELRLLPIGGHVQWGSTPYPDPPPGPWLSRFLLTIAGPVATLVLASGVFFVLHVAFQARTLNGRPVATRVVKMPTGAAISAGLRPDDVIVEIDGQSIEYFDEVSRLVGRSAGRPLQVTVRRQQPGADAPVMGVTGTLEGREVLGPLVDDKWPAVVLSIPPDPTTGGYELGARPRVARLGSDSWLGATALAAVETIATLRLLFDPSPVSWPISPTHGDAVSPILHLLALLSLVAFVVNLLLPAHDLHRIVLLLLEALVRRPLSSRTEIVWVRVEVLLLLASVVLFLAWYVVRAISPV